MKIQPIVVFWELCLGLGFCQAQSSLGFQATLNGQSQVPANDSPYVGYAAFSLSGDSFSYAVALSGCDFVPTAASIRGPAAPRIAGPAVYELGGFQCDCALPPPVFGVVVPVLAGAIPKPPEQPPTDQCVLWASGSFTVTGPQAADLTAGLWYVNLASAAYPVGEFRGQILPVPEPATWASLGLGAAVLLLRGHRRR